MSIRLMDGFLMGDETRQFRTDSRLENGKLVFNYSHNDNILQIKNIINISD